MIGNIKPNISNNIIIWINNGSRIIGLINKLDIKRRFISWN